MCDVIEINIFFCYGIWTFSIEEKLPIATFWLVKYYDLNIFIENIIGMKVLNQIY